MIKTLKTCLLIGFALMAAACTTTQTRVVKTLPERPAAGSTILVFEPDIALTLLTATGLTEPKSDWNSAARTHVQSQLQAALTGRQHQFVTVNPDDLATGRTNQVLRLHDAVARSILAFNYGLLRLPTRPTNDFTWTLGSGAGELARASPGGSAARYALITFGRGSYSSGGRYALAVLAAAAGTSVPMGGQQVYASLVDLQSGRIIWFNVATAGPGDDMRQDEGARALVTQLMKDVPL